tara:strand:- start:15401 stop:16825 length:1425 start_codon:yes stop_codon:yes gene_type:complete
MYDKFKEQITKAKDFFYGFDKTKPIRIMSHLDADGISAASILIRMLNLENRKYAVSIMQLLTKESLQRLADEDYEFYIFTDLGSGQIENIVPFFKNKKVLILDHHTPQEIDEVCDNIFHVNPHLCGINGTDEISGAGVVYYFSKECNNDIKYLAHIAVVGAIGDFQESNGFKKLNKDILDSSVENGLITIKNGLKFFGAITKPLHRILQYSTDIFIPGVSGSESGAIQFLQSLGINPKNGNDWRKLAHLTEEEVSKLVTGIVMRRASETKPEDIIGPIYIINSSAKESPTRDAREFSTLLNSCGRMDKASLGIGVCLGDETTTQKAILSQKDYKRELMEAIKWYNENKNTELFVKKGEGYVIINAGEHIRPQIIGTLASIISRSNDVLDNVFIMSLARNDNGTTKISLRVSGIKRDPNLDLRKIMKDMVKRVSDGEAGGHQFAAGAVVSTECEPKLVAAAKDLLSHSSKEESVV